MQKRLSPKVNDILLAKNGTTGVAAIVDRDVAFDIYVSLALLRPSKLIHPRFLWHFINSPSAKRQFNKRLKGVGVPNLHLNEIREVTISFPEKLTEQDVVVIHLNNLLQHKNNLESIYRKKLTALAELKQSLLKKAFSGELTKEAIKEPSKFKDLYHRENLQRRNLQFANFDGATLYNVDFSGAFLEYATLIGAMLQGADLTDVKLTGADLFGADLTNADLTYADLTNTVLTDARSLAKFS